MATVRFFAAAAEAAATESTTLDAATIGDIRIRLGERFGTDFAAVFARCSLLVNGARAGSDAVSIGADDTVDVLPPFAGG